MDSMQTGEITRRYRSGQSTTDIARDLRLRSVDVITCIRGLQPPSMGTRIARPSTVERTVAPAMPPAPAPVRCDPPRPPAARALRRAVPPPQPAVQTVLSEPDDMDDDEPVVRQGCPPGWLVSEADYHAAFERSGGRFLDAVFKRR